MSTQRIPILKGSLDDDPHLSFLRQRKTLTVMFIGIICLVWFAFSRNEDAPPQDNLKFGVIAGSLCFICFCVAQLKDGVFIRPHPAFWRAVTACGLLYLCGLVFLLFQSASEARNWLRNIDPRLGVPLPERSYAEDCRLYTPEAPVELLGYPLPFKNIIAALDDRFVWAHFIGWWGKTILFRDVYICWLSSVLFEIMELSLQHMLPNFAECWWDHIILDVFGANLIGIILGGFTLRYFEMKSYDWTDSGWPDRPLARKDALHKFLFWFSPRVDELHWDWLDSWSRFAGTIMLLVLNQGSELTAFFLKFILWVPAEHNLNIVRLLIWWAIAAPATRELYLYCTDDRVKKIGHNLWLVIAILTVETLLCVKFGHAMFEDAHPPPLLKTSWLIVIAAVGSFCLYKLNHNIKRRQYSTSTSSNKKKNTNCGNNDTTTTAAAPHPKSE
jgi:phosphatidylserine synthase 2